MIIMKNVFARAGTIARLEKGTLGRQILSLFTAMLEQRYAVGTIRKYLRECRDFGSWLDENNLQQTALSNSIIESYLSFLGQSPNYSFKGKRRTAPKALHKLIRHLEEIRTISKAAIDGNFSNEELHWLVAYQAHMLRLQGLAIKTRTNYLRYAKRLLKVVSIEGCVDWSVLTASRLVEFVRNQCAQRKGFGPRDTTVCVRSFLRFLISQNVLPSELVAAIPVVRRWSQSHLPQHLNEAETKRLLSICADSAGIKKRNHAILLLLVRLGLRAKEVTNLELNDIDWRNGLLFIRRSKTYRERSLPLVQDVGAVLLAYIRNDRPKTAHRNIFLRHTAPYGPLKNTSTITKMVQGLLAEAGIKRVSSGAHLLRHTVATDLINRGANFKAVADILGHRSLQTTAIYAKLDLTTLALIALPWPGSDQ